MEQKVSSTARLRKSNVSRKSFNKSAAKLSFHFNEKASDTSAAEKVKLWNRFIPVTPAQAAKILSRDLPEGAVIELDLRDDGTGDIFMHAGDKFNDDGSFDLDEALLEAGLIRVANGYKGQGIGRTVFRNQIEFFYVCGVRRFEIFAALDNGGYTWARLGFLPDEDDHHFKGSVGKHGRASVKALGPLLSKGEKKQLRQLLKLKDPKDLWRLADADVDLGPRLKDVFQKAAAPDVSSREKAMAQDTVESLRAHFSGELFSYMRQKAEEGKPVMAGRLLLSGTSWDGYIDMDDPEQMERVGAYTGGWKYLSIK